ncbi:MAG: ATP-binding protein, partial [bacterium]
RKDIPNNEVIISVQDTGIGIKKEDASKLFQQFQQLGGKNTRKTGGTGLGLAISKQIIEHHGGRIWAKIEYNKGAIFNVSLPIVRRANILIIDDEKGVLDVCEKILGRDNYHVICSLEGKDGIEKAVADQPDLIVLDMRLKDINGSEVIKLLKSKKETGSIPILAMSGFTEEIDKIQNQHDKNFLPWLIKPFERDEFLSKVRSLVHH